MEHSDSKTGDNGIVRALHRLSVETGSLACFGCGREHNCSTHGCAILRAAAHRIESLQEQLAAYQKYGEPCDWRGVKNLTEDNDRLKAENLDLAKMIAESQQREQAAVATLTQAASDCGFHSTPCNVRSCVLIPWCRWHGSQEARRGEAQ